MSKDPAVLFYTADFLVGTQFFTYAEIGQYTKALCLQHQVGHLTENQLLEIVKTPDSPVWKKFKKDPSGNYYNIRMDDEIKKRRIFCDSRRQNINKRWKKNNKPLSNKKIDPIHVNNICNTSVIHMENENINEIKGSVRGKKSQPKRPSPKPLEERESDFKKEVFAVTGYPSEMLTEFFNYWSESDRLKIAMRFEDQKTWDLKKRLANWYSRSKYHGHRSPPPRTLHEFERNAAAKYDSVPQTQIGSAP
jgi:hypothetical protein